MPSNAPALPPRGPARGRRGVLVIGLRYGTTGTVTGPVSSSSGGGDGAWAGMNGSRPVDRGTPHFQQKAPVVSTAAPQFPHCGIDGDGRDGGGCI